MPHVDEGLLCKLVDKYGIEPVAKGPQRAKLWAKVTKEYNSITGNMHTKARLDKKWQNLKHTRKVKRNNLLTITEGIKSMDSSSSTSVTSSFQEMGENMWNVMDHALRDLFLYLVKKYNIEHVTNPRQKNELWKTLSKEFHDNIENVVTIKHEKFTKKWQNWKQYNKVKGKTHPLQDETLEGLWIFPSKSCFTGFTYRVGHSNWPVLLITIIVRSINPKDFDKSDFFQEQF